MNKPKERWKCLCCGRDKFDRPYQPHRCSCGGGTTHHWKKIAKKKKIEGPTFIRIPG